MTIDPWWVRDPARLEREEAALQAAGLAFQRVEQSFARGVAQLTVTLEGPAGATTVTATYPDAYPYFKPMVTGSDLGLEHHWNPNSGEFCLLEPSDWRPVADTLATLLTNQWEAILAANAGDGVTRDGELLEVDQAEPLTMYMQCQPGSHLVLDLLPDLPDEADNGQATVLLTLEEPLRGYIANFVGTDGDDLLPGSGRLFVEQPAALTALWVRLSQPLRSIRPGDVWAAVRDVAPSLEAGPWAPWPSKANQGNAAQFAEHVQLVIVTFPEESARRETGPGWVGVLRTRPNRRKPPRPPQLVKIVRAGRAELMQRTPELVAMQDKSVLVVGGGGLGSVLTQFIAGMCPRELAIIDGDEVDAATAVRFPSAFRFAGARKTDALGQLTRETQPYTDTQGSLPVRLGLPRWDRADVPNLHDEVSRRVEAADIVIDATADRPTQHYLSDRARATATAYLQAEATPGVWGGLVALYPPASDACWMCLQHHLDRSLDPLPAKTEAGVQPPGCGQPTYTGTGFDLATIATHAVRVMAAFLTGGRGYGAFTHDLFTLELRDAAGNPIPARWTGRELPRHPDCANHPDQGA